METQNKALRNAIAFASDGHGVIPLHGIANGKCTCGKADCSSPGKHPHLMAPKGLKNATNVIGTIKQWWEAFPDINAGILTDKLVVLDVDPRHGGDDTLRELEEKNGELPPTWRQLTGGDGEHIIFKQPRARKIRSSTGKLGPGLDIKGIGGYIVGPGSMHVSGRPYAWSVDHHPSETPLRLPPGWLIAALTETRTNGGPRPPEYYDGLIAVAVEGERNIRIASLVGHLLGACRPDPVVLLQLVLSWNQSHCMPPLEGDEVIDIFKSIHACEVRKVR